jgi:cold shock protein
LSRVESLAGSAYNADIRAWPCLSRTTWRAFNSSNASDERSRGGRAAAVRYVQIKEAMMATGTVKWFNPTKGYGFIQPSDGGRDVFVHISAVERAGLTSLNEGQTVEYELVSNRGKQAAENLKAR